MEPPRGILRSATASAKSTRHVRYHPSPDLAPYVEHYWSVAWDYRGHAPEQLETLPHPSVHLIFERSVGARITGVTRGKFTRILSGKGAVFGVKFAPGGFYPFLRAPLSTITDTTASVRSIFGTAGVDLARSILARRTDAACVALVEDFLRRHVHERDDTAIRMAQLVYAVARDRTILKVEDLAARAGTNTRMLQRLFAKYVGVSPKWVIQRYRLHEAAEQLADGGAVTQSALALSLGYSDQAHFVRDFKRIVGASPAAYARDARD